MSKIDVDSFRFIWEQIDNKLEEIANIPKLFSPSGRGKDFDGYEIDSSGITYKTSTYYSGCGDEDEQFTIEWHEMNKPLEYFKAKFQKEITEWEETQKKNKEMEKQREEESEYKKYQELKSKYEAKFIPIESDESDELTKRYLEERRII